LRASKRLRDDIFKTLPPHWDLPVPREIQNILRFPGICLPRVQIPE
jgi:hypothetical protein